MLSQEREGNEGPCDSFEPESLVYLAYSAADPQRRAHN